MIASSPMSDIHESLLQSLRSGDCIAFLGSGFTSAANLPSWRTLLQQLAGRPEIDDARRAHVQALLEKRTAHANDEAAQVLEDGLGRAVFTADLAARLGRPEPTPAMEARLRWLRGIPFRAILTTNFDTLLDGHTPAAGAFRSVLRPEGSDPWWKRLFRDGGPTEVPVLKIHGDVRHPETVVLTRKDYRRLLYGTPGYQGFLRAVLANRPVLYLGFSFTDAYLNELRSEILALLGYTGDVPLAHAIISDVPELTRAHYLQHEGINILTYDTLGQTDYSGFDRLLASIHHQTNPLFHFSSLLADKRLLWVDPTPGNNEHLTRFFDRAHEARGVRPSSAQVELCAAGDEALARIEAAASSAKPFDVVITHWGSKFTPPTAVRLLEGVRQRDLRVPVLIFSKKAHADARKPQALAMGAQAYCFSNDGLLRSIERILSPGLETG
jgi:hypothetical protein